MKVALCFIISYEHILNKEKIWKKWIAYNKDIINVYFYYKDLDKIKSAWIKEHVIPRKYICETTYLHVIPAYMSIMNYALKDNNEWFCFLTDSCCPIISPKRFRYLFFKYNQKSIFSWRKAWWNPDYHTRANLKRLPENYRLANDPWFVLKKEDVKACLQYYYTKYKIVKLICEGGLANESLFAIMLYCSNKLNNAICYASHATDWSRMSSSTSPHVFTEFNNTDLKFIEKTLKENKYTLFIRKISPEFPDEILEKYIYEYSKEKDDMLVIKEPVSWIIPLFHLLYLLLYLYLFADIILEFYGGIPQLNP